MHASKQAQREADALRKQRVEQELKRRETSPIYEATKRIESDVNTSYGKTALTAPKRNDVDYGQDSEDDNQEPIYDTEQKTRIVTTLAGGNQSVPYADPGYGRPALSTSSV